jgi:hypothetical protein
MVILWKYPFLFEEKTKKLEKKIHIIPFKVALGDHLSHILSKNHLNDDYYRRSDTEDEHFLTVFEAYASNQKSPKGYELHYTDGSCTIKLSAGRMVHLGLYAGFIRSVAFVMPLTPLSYTQAVTLVKKMIIHINQAGFKLLTHHNIQKRKKWDRIPVASWISCAYPKDSIAQPLQAYFTLDIRYYKTAFKAPKQYLIRIRATNYALDDETHDLMIERRVEVNGDKNKPLPLSIWLDTPLWRPKEWKGKYIK